jgi:outer membrane protein TolC
MTMKSRTTVLLGALVAMLGAPAAARSQDTSLAELLAEADAASPRIASARRTAEAAAARVPQAGALPDPMVGLGFMNVPVSRPGLGNDMMTMAQVKVSAEFPWPGKLGLGEEVARLEARASDWDVERVRQEVRAETQRLYYEIYFVDRALEVTSRNEALLRDFARLTSSRYGVGVAGQPDVLRAQVERTRLADQLVALREERTSAAARLNALVARATDTPVTATELPEAVRTAALGEAEAGPRFASATLNGLLPGGGPDAGMPSVADLQRLALDRNPMIQAHVQRVESRRSALELAGRASLPDFNVSAGYSGRSGFGDFFDVMVSAPVPIFAGRKQNQAMAEQAATLAEHEARHHAMVNELNGEIASLYARLARAREQLVLLGDGILPQARTGLSSATASYRVGRVDFLGLLDAQVTLYRHELEYHRLLADFATNLASLERAVGTEVLQ